MGYGRIIPPISSKWVLPDLTTLPAGALMVGYQFASLASSDTTAADSSANGITITKIAGTTKVNTEPFGNIRGLGLDAASTYWQAAANAAFINTGAMTLEVLFNKNYQGANDYMLHIGIDGSTAAKNRTIIIIVKAKGAVDYLHESGVGTVRTFNTAIQVPNGETGLMHITRDSAGTGVAAYWNGMAINSTTLAAAPSDGSAGSLTIGGTSTGTNLFNGVIYSLAYVDAEWTAAQISARYAAIKV